MTNGEWSDFGEACFITAPGTIAVAKGNAVAAIEKPQQDSVFRAVAYPNPYAETFAVDANFASQENVSVKVYDMVGKMVENREFASDAVQAQKFGESYPSGVYNVIVTQGSEVKTLRVIKR